MPLRLPVAGMSEDYNDIVTIDERLQALTQSMELLSTMHRDNEKRMGQMMDAVGRLARVVDLHQDRLDEHDGRIDRLEDR